MDLKNKVVLITGANRGIGKALVQASLNYGAAKIYAAARNPEKLPNFVDSRVVPLELDITNIDLIQEAVKKAKDINLLINNAGALAFASILQGNMPELKNDMEVNYFGTLNVTRVFAPLIAGNGGGIATISSVVGLAPMAGIGGYSASKAALHSAIQAMRSELKPKQIEVFGIYPGPIDTDMARGFEIEKTSPQVTAENILASIVRGEEDIFPDAMSSQIGALWKSDPKALERQFASM